jgi:hypothetical protein
LSEGFERTRPPRALWVPFEFGRPNDLAFQKRAILPNLGGSLPNDIFATDLGMPTVWVPHSYASCSQHAPNEHMLMPVAREALQVMAGIYWDLGEPGVPPKRD